MKTKIALICMLFATSSFSCNSFAKSISNENMKIEAVLETFEKGESFSQGNATYTLYPELRAEFKSKKVSDQTKSLSQSANETPKSNFVVSTDKFNIVKANKSEQKSSYSVSGMKETNDSRYPVVLNTKTGDLGILTGSIIIQTKNNVLFSDSSFQLKKSYPKLGFYIVSIPENGNINDALKKIIRNKDVDHVTVEVLENFKEPM